MAPVLIGANLFVVVVCVCMRFRPAALLLLPLSFCLGQNKDDESQKALLSDPHYQFTKAELFLAEGNYAEALRYYRLAADQGSAEAQCGLANMYREGQGVPQDDKEAVWLYRLSAEKGWPPAQFNLGVMYDNGRGVPQDYAEAARWYKITADLDIADAEYNLGVLYANGKGVPQDYKEAARLYRRAAETRELKEAAFNLAVLY